MIVVVKNIHSNKKKILDKKIKIFHLERFLKGLSVVELLESLSSSKFKRRFILSSVDSKGVLELGSILKINHIKIPLQCQNEVRFRALNHGENKKERKKKLEHSAAD